jgi:hypothetical protein
MPISVHEVMCGVVTHPAFSAYTRTCVKMSKTLISTNDDSLSIGEGFQNKIHFINLLISKNYKEIRL